MDNEGYLKLYWEGEVFSGKKIARKFLSDCLRLQESVKEEWRRQREPLYISMKDEKWKIRKYVDVHQIMDG